MNSIERRLQLALATALVILFALLWLLGDRAIHALTEDYIVSRLEHDAENILAALVLDQGHPRVRRNRVSEIYHQPFSGHYYQLLLSDGSEIRSRSLWDQRLQHGALQPGEQRRSIGPGPNGQTLLLLEQGFSKQRQILTLTMAEEMTPLEIHRQRFERHFALFALVSLLGLLAVQGIIVRRMLRRLLPIQQQIKELAEGRRSQLTGEVPREIVPLVDELNHLALLMGQRLQRSRNALGNLAHALKGPLNILTQYLEQPADGEQTQQQAYDQALRIRQLMERELKRARLAGEGVPGQLFSAERELPDLVDVLRQIHRLRSLEIEVEIAGDIPPFADREDMLELIGNLLDNACKWASKTVRCRIAEGEQITIRIENDGTGLSEEALARLTQRGVRLDEETEGHGLGLAIVKEIVRLYRGRIEFTTSQQLGGLQVEVRLPRRTDRQR
ncbi:MAG: sensor histidine kinase [Gammaproteobacteria bacterium]|nr:sensor histidine kinase [Gammaproteobacteria bacterium]